MLKLETLNEVLAEKLSNPAEVLDLLITALAKGQHPALEWGALHAAASRDGLVGELASAYEAALAGRRIKLVSPANQAEAYLHAAEFFAERANDTDAAIEYAERALGAAPGHEAAFALLERVLRAKGDRVRLARAYLELAGAERDRDRQLAELRQAAGLLAGQEGTDELAIEVHQRILRVDPADATSLAALIARYAATGKHRESARLLEQALGRVEGAEAQPLRRQLIAFYCDELNEPQRAMPHVEALLAEVPGDERALAAAEALLDNKVMAPRAVTALADAYLALGRSEDAAAMLTRELKTARGPRRLEVQKRLGILKQDALNDLPGALELLGPAVTADPADDALRRRFVELSLSLEQPLEAARLLGRALQPSSDPEVRARIGATLGIVYLTAGDVRRAQAEFESVVEAGIDESAVLVSASSLVDIFAEAGNSRRLADVLEIVVRLEPPGDARVAAARRLARVCDEVGDAARGTPAWEALLDTEWEDEALERLQALYDQAGKRDALAAILERRAGRATDPAEARQLAFRVADLRSSGARDRDAALRAWQSYLDVHGPSREAHARLLPLLEQEQRWSEVDRVLRAEIELAPAAEHAALWARSGQGRGARLDDPAGAVAAFGAALAADPKEPSSRAALEQLLRVPEVAHEAAALLEPLYRSEGRRRELARVLELRAGIGSALAPRLAALGEAAEIAQRELGDPEWALALAGRGLTAVSAGHPELILPWLERVIAFADAAGNPTLRARVLVEALGESPVDGPERLALARATAEALAATDEVQRAVAVYRQALRYDPASTELLQKVDELLALQGSPEERLALYRQALAQPCAPARRRELLHAMARLQRRDLHDIAAAVQTWRTALAADPGDHAAHQGLVEIFTEQARWDELHAELTRVLELVAPERRVAVRIRLAEVDLARGNRAGALAQYAPLVRDGALDDDGLAAVEELARTEGATPLVREVLERRVALATEPLVRATLLERLGTVLAERAGDPEAAAQVWLEAARLRETSAPDAARALSLYEAVLRVAPRHRDAAERLVELYAMADEWNRARAAFDVLVAGATDDGDLVSRIAALEPRAVAAGQGAAFVELIDSALGFQGLTPPREQSLWLVKARVLGTEPGEEDRVAAIYRRVIDAGLDAAATAAESFGQFLAARPPTPARLEDRRWLFEWRAEHAADPTAVWLEWAAVEERELGDPARGIALYRRVLERDPARAAALAELARLLAETGDADAAGEALRSLRATAEGDAARARDAKIAGLLLEPLGRAEEALDAARRVRDATPTDVGALDVVRRVLKGPGRAARAAAVLEQVAAGSEDPAARAAVLESLLALAAAGGELNEARQRWFMQLLECREEDPEASLAVALRGASAHPGADELWAAAERLARRLDRPGPVADAYAAVLDGDLSSDLAEAVGRRMVEFFEEWFEDPDRVVALLKRVLELAPGADWAFDRLKLAFNGSARWDELFALYDGALARTHEAPARVVLLREAAMAAKDFAADAPRAIGYLEQLNWLVPTDGAVEGTLERLYEREGMLRALIELYTRRLDRVPPAERNDLRRRIAELWIAVGDALPAFEILNEMRNDAAVGEGTYRLIERVVELDTARSSIAPGSKPRRGKQASVREVGAGLLREYYERAGRVADVARMLEIGLEFARSDRERVMRLTELVELRLTRLDDVPGAFQNVSSLVTLEPGVADHRRLLAELAARIGAQAARAALLAAVAREQSALPLRAALLEEAASVHVELLAEPAAAIELYFELLELAGSDRELALGAARSLDPLLAEAGRPGEHCDVLERRAALEDDPGARRAARGAAARIAAAVLRALDRAARHYRLRLADDPADLEALDGLVEVLERAGHYSELIEALGARARTRTDPVAARADLVRIARLYEETLHARLPAIQAWREVRARTGRDEESFVALVPLLEAESRWSELAELVEVEAAEAEDPARQRDRYRQLGEIHRTRTHRPRAAVEAFVAAEEWDAAIATAADPALAPEVGLGVCRGLMELAVAAWRKQGTAATGAARAAAWAVEDLTARLRALGRHAEVAELLLGAAGLPFERQRQRELRRDAAGVLQDDLGAEDQALEILRGIFAEDAGDAIATATVSRLAALLEARALHDEVAELWEAQARARQAGGDPTTSAELWARAARLWEERVGDVDRAIVDHRAGAALGGEESLEALARIHHARGERRAEAEVLETLCAQSAAGLLSERALRLADAYVAAGERGLARTRLEETVRSADDPGPLRRRLAELYREDGDFTQLAALLTSEAARTSDPRARLGLLLEAARLHLDQRGEPGDAVPLLEQAVELDPEEPELRLSLSRALELGGRYDEASQILRQQIELFGARRPKNRALVHFQLARVSLAAGRRAEAIAELGAANKIDPAHPGILQALARIAYEEGQYERAKKTYSALLLLIRPAEDRDAPSRAEALLDLAEIASKCDDPIQAAEFVESAFETALEHPGEAVRLEASLRARGRRDLLARSIEARVERARRPEDAARALADLVMLHVGEGGAGGAGAPLVPETVRTRAQAIQAELERTGVTAEEPWSALGRIYDFLGDADAEVRVLERRVAIWQKRGGGTADAGPLYRLAEIRLSEPSTVDEGLALLERALSAHPDPARAIGILDVALQRNPAAEGLVDLLERLARARGDDRTLARALTARLSAPTADGALLREAVALAAKTGDGALEERALQRGLALALSDEDASWVRLALADRAHRAGDRARAVELRIEAAELLGGDAGRAALLAAAATLRDELELPERAAELYRSLLASEPGDREAWEPLLVILRQLGRGDDLLELIRQTVPLVDLASERTRLRLEQAEMELARGDDAAATITLQQVLDDDPNDAQAALLLSGILERSGRADELVALLERQLDAAKDRDDLEAVVTISLRIAGLQEERGRLDAAFDAYRSVLDWSARNRPALEAVVRLAEVRKDPYSQADALESLLEGVTGQEAVPLAERLVAIRRELHDADGIDRALALAFAAAPGHEAFREELIARYVEREDHLAVLDVLKRAVEVNAKDSALVRRLIAAYRAAGQPEQALAMLQEVLAAEKASASLLPQRAALLGELGREEEALADAERAHAIGLVSDEELVSALERVSVGAPPERALELGLRLVSVLEARGDLASARGRLTELLERHPDHAAAWRRLAELSGRAEDWDGALVAFQRLVALEQGEGLVDAALGLYDAAYRANRLADALEGLERALAAAPGHAIVRARLQEAYEAVGDHRGLARMLESESAQAADPGDAFALLLRAGALLLEPDGDPQEALRVLEAARALGTDSFDAVVLLARALGALGRTEEGMNLLRETIEANRGKRLKGLAVVHVELSRFHLEDGMLTDAMDALQRGFDMDPRNATIAMQLGQLGLEMEEYETAAKAFRAATMMRPYDPATGEGITSAAKADAQYCLAWLAFNEGDARKAKVLANKALAENPEHELAKTLLAEVGG